MAARAKVWIYDRSFAGIACLNPAGGIDVSIMGCQVEVSPSLLSFFQRRTRSHIAYGVSECDREALIMRRP